MVTGRTSPVSGCGPVFSLGMAIGPVLSQPLQMTAVYVTLTPDILVQVAPADPAPLNGNEDLVLARHRGIYLLNPHITACVESRGAHFQEVDHVCGTEAEFGVSQPAYVTIRSGASLATGSPASVLRWKD